MEPAAGVERRHGPRTGGARGLHRRLDRVDQRAGEDQADGLAALALLGHLGVGPPQPSAEDAAEVDRDRWVTRKQFLEAPRARGPAPRSARSPPRWRSAVHPCRAPWHPRHRRDAAWPPPVAIPQPTPRRRPGRSRPRSRTSPLRARRPGRARRPARSCRGRICIAIVGSSERSMPSNSVQPLERRERRHPAGHRRGRHGALAPQLRHGPALPGRRARGALRDPAFPRTGWGARGRPRRRRGSCSRRSRRGRNGGSAAG